MSTLNAVILVRVVVSSATAVVTEAIAMWFFRRWVVRFLTALAVQQKSSSQPQYGMPFRACDESCPFSRQHGDLCMCGKVGDITK